MTEINAAGFPTASSLYIVYRWSL